MADETIGTRCKRFEAVESDRRGMPGLPLLARLDGRAFHTYTAGLPRPYDERLSSCFVDTTKALVEDLQARVGYTQSDEITLLFFEETTGDRQLPFDGRFQKIASVLAGLASSTFSLLAARRIPERAGQPLAFDCRVWQVPTRADALEAFVWREDDATKNSVSMAASAYFPHEELDGVATSGKHELLHSRGINWNDYPAFFKRGTYVQRRTTRRPLDEERRLAIPEPHRPPPGTLVERGVVTALELPPIRRVANAIEVLFDGAEARPRP